MQHAGQVSPQGVKGRELRSRRELGKRIALRQEAALQHRGAIMGLDLSGRE
jgi:hypothetical protein